MASSPQGALSPLAWIERMEPPVSNLLAAAQSALSADGWHPEAATDAPALTMGYHGDNGVYECMVIVDDASALLLCTALARVTVAAERQPPLLEYLNLANVALDAGSLEMLPDATAIRARTAIEGKAGQVTPEQICRVMQRACEVIDHYSPGVAAICNTRIGAAGAMALVAHRAALARSDAGG